jgi:hypothetical protein
MKRRMIVVKVYVVVGLFAYESENVFVGFDKSEVLSLKPSDFGNFDSLIIEVWENGRKIGYLDENDNVST